VVSLNLQFAYYFYINSLFRRTTSVNVIFAYVGMDIVAATAAESRALADAESMKMAARKISLRIITLYSLAMLTASFVVPMDHPFINGGGQSVGSRSVFVIAVVEAGIPAAAHFFNAIFVFSSFTCAINSMYVASRVLHTLALQDQTGPEFITRRLRQCRSGVPLRAVLVTAIMMLIGYMGRTGSPGEVSSVNIWYMLKLGVPVLIQYRG
jgi:amino acid transporter